MKKNKFWVVRLEGKEPELFESYSEYEKKVNGVSRVINHGFPTKDEAMEFIAGKWRGNPVSEEARRWLEEYKASKGRLIQDTVSDKDKRALSSEALPKYCAYVDGSYDPKNECYGFGVVFVLDGNVEKFYGGGEEKDLIEMGCGAGELLACMEAIKYAADLSLPELTIIYDSQLIPWAYHGCGGKMLTQAASQYMYDIREKVEITVKSINGLSHESGEDPGIALADKLAKKGAGLAGKII